MNKNFYDFDEFITLKALRNLYYHEQELLNELRIIPVEQCPDLATDMFNLCLVPSATVIKSFDHINKKFRKKESEIIRNTLKWYGEVVNINPCIFNFSVKAYEKANNLSLELSCEEYHQIKKSYDFETKNGYPHFISGDIFCHAGNVNEILMVAFQ